MLTAVAFFLGYVDFHLAETQVLSVASTYVFFWALAGWGAVIAVQCLASRRMTGTVIALYANHVAVLGALLAIVVCSFVFALLPTAYWNDGPMYLLYPPYDALVVVLSMSLAVHRLHRTWFRLYLLAAFLVLAASVLYDALVPGTFSLVPDRAAGFAENPNTAAFVLVLLCVSVVDLDRFRPRDSLLFAVAGMAVFLTLSRGGALLFLFAFAYYGYRTVRTATDRYGRLLRRVGVLLAVPAGVALGASMLVERADIFSLPFQPRLEMVRGESELFASDDDRIDALNEAWRLVSMSPVIGYGTGYSYSVRGVTPHNMYLQQWINNGLPGLLAYVALLGTAGVTFFRRGHQQGVLFVLLVTINGFFSHNILEERAFLGLLGILLASSFFERNPAVVPAVTRARLRPALT
jgi:O-antigen ligase